MSCDEAHIWLLFQIIDSFFYIKFHQCPYGNIRNIKFHNNFKNFFVLEKRCIKFPTVYLILYRLLDRNERRYTGTCYRTGGNCNGLEVAYLRTGVGLKWRKRKTKYIPVVKMISI